MMNTMMKDILIFILFIATSLLVAACSGSAEIGAPPPKEVCRSIIDNKCVKCHYKTRICAKLGTLSVGKWKQTIKFMIRQGADLTQDEHNKVIACLSSLPEGSDVVCQ